MLRYLWHSVNTERLASTQLMQHVAHGSAMAEVAHASVAKRDRNRGAITNIIFEGRVSISSET